MTEIYDWTAGPACIASFPPKMFDDRTAGKRLPGYVLRRFAIQNNGKLLC